MIERKLEEHKRQQYLENQRKKQMNDTRRMEAQNHFKSIIQSKEEKQMQK